MPVYLYAFPAPSVTSLTGQKENKHFPRIFLTSKKDINNPGPPLEAEKSSDIFVSYRHLKWRKGGGGGGAAGAATPSGGGSDTAHTPQEAKQTG